MRKNDDYSWNHRVESYKFIWFQMNMRYKHRKPNSSNGRTKISWVMEWEVEDGQDQIGALPLVSGSPSSTLSNSEASESQLCFRDRLLQLTSFSVCLGGGRGFAGVIEGGRRGIEIGSVGKFEALIGYSQRIESVSVIRTNELAASVFNHIKNNLNSLTVEEAV